MSDASRIVAVEAGGCAPPILVPHDPAPLLAIADAIQAMDRAHVEAGIMPLADYVRIYGREGEGNVDAA